MSETAYLPCRFIRQMRPVGGGREAGTSSSFPQKTSVRCAAKHSTTSHISLVKATSGTTDTEL